VLRTNPKAIEFARQIALKEYATRDLCKAGLRLIKESTKHMERYDERRFGSLPQNMVDHYYKHFTVCKHVIRPIGSSDISL